MKNIVKNVICGLILVFVAGLAWSQSNVSVFASGFNNPRGLKFGPDGNLYVANIRVDANFQDIGSEILRFDPVSGQFLGRLVPAGVGLNVPFAMRFGQAAYSSLFRPARS